MPQVLNAQLAMVSIPTEDVGKTRDFFQRLLGIEMVRNLEETAESYHTPVSQDGIDLVIGPPRTPQETPMVHFHVDNIDTVLRELRSLGGEVLFGPQAIQMSEKAFQLYRQAYSAVARFAPVANQQMGRMAVVQEPGGASIGLVELEEHLHEHFQVGKAAQPLTDRQLEFQRMGSENARKMFGGDVQVATVGRGGGL